VKHLGRTTRVMPKQEVIMTSATMKPARSAGGGYAQGRGLGMIIFAAAMLAVIGFFNLLDGIAAIANSHIFIGNAHPARPRPGSWRRRPGITVVGKGQVVAP
jgi:hypothetical protein